MWGRPGFCWLGASSTWRRCGGWTVAGAATARRRTMPAPRVNVRTLLAVLHDAAAAAFAWSFAYLLRFNFDLPENFAIELRHTLFWVVPLQMLVFWQFGLYRGIWRYASTADLHRIVLAVLMSAAAIPLMFWMLR